VTESDADSELGTSASAVTRITVMSVQKDFERILPLLPEMGMT
jgi:hypothetical protein